MTDKDIVIVGASHGGVQMAASLREKGYEGPLTMLTSEPDLPYQKPPLSKGYIKEPDPKPTILRPEKFYTDRNIDLRLGTEATAIDRGAGSVTLATLAAISAPVAPGPAASLASMAIMAASKLLGRPGPFGSLSKRSL